MVQRLRQSILLLFETSIEEKPITASIRVRKTPKKKMAHVHEPDVFTAEKLEKQFKKRNTIFETAIHTLYEERVPVAERMDDNRRDGVSVGDQEESKEEVQQSNEVSRRRRVRGRKRSISRIDSDMDEDFDIDQQSAMNNSNTNHSNTNNSNTNSNTNNLRRSSRRTKKKNPNYVGDQYDWFQSLQ